jgi:regulator of ribosome biosynthesis
MANTYHLDPGMLCITQTSIVSGPTRTEDDYHHSATKAVHKLFGEILALPTVLKKGKENEAAIEVVQLPVPEVRLPREKAPPKEKPMTAWQKFALKKGIALGKKKVNKTWDEDRQTWKDKWGKRAREDERKFDWVREVKSNYVPGEEGSDPFLDDRRKKQASLSVAKKNADRNRRREEMQSRTQDEVAKMEKTFRSIATASNGRYDIAGAAVGKKGKGKR